MACFILEAGNAAVVRNPDAVMAIGIKRVYVIVAEAFWVAGLMKKCSKAVAIKSVEAVNRANPQETRFVLYNLADLVVA